MFKKMTDEQQAGLLETGIAEFAAKGLDGANINVIAAKAGISIGVLYKYYGDKESFFLACVRRSLSALDAVLQEQIESTEEPLANVRKLIRALQHYSRENRNYINMYHWITTGGDKKYTALLVKEIETRSAAVYTKLISDLKAAGKIRSDIDPALFAFFFDNLLMMLHFSYCSDYYRERFAIYCGVDTPENDDRVASELLKFIGGAFACPPERLSSEQTKEKT